MKVCLIASSGGHYEQIIMLKGLSEHFEIFFVTEKTKYNLNSDNNYYLKQINRYEKSFLFKQIYNCYKTAKIFAVEKPDVIISTGALSVIPMFIFGKLFRKKLIFIESFAKSESPTLTGRFIYMIADIFIIQWESMKKFYPKAIFLGTIY